VWQLADQEHVPLDPAVASPFEMPSLLPSFRSHLSQPQGKAQEMGKNPCGGNLEHRKLL